ncbi:MAG: methyltransferase domain-containing protein [Magnetospiraceae bacterium]
MPQSLLPAAATLGPIADLEAHLPAEWWRELFDSLYLKTDGDVVENDINTRHDIDLLIQATGIAPRDRLLDLCCGQGRHSLALAELGYRAVTGIDRSKYLVRLARQRAQQRRLSASFKTGDARFFRVPENSFDCVFLMGNSFGYFDVEADDRRVIDSVKRAMRGGGRIALDLTDGAWMKTHFEPRSWEWIDDQHFVCRERTLSADQSRLISREVVTHAERGVIADRFYAERLYTEEKINVLLTDAGFGNVVFHGIPKVESTRGQDLGMMSRRLFLTADAPPKQRRAKPIPGTTRVTVLLGDPRLADPVKRDGKFNAEDTETVNRLKAALASLDGYSFRYLDNHQTLPQDLKRGRHDLIFNLCDEGFNNDAFKELHVPALLEMLNLPYTGGGPACLGQCYDKALVRAVAMANEIPVPLETYVAVEDSSASIPWTLPALLKPAFGDSSEGITQDAIVHDATEMMNRIKKLHERFPARPVLVQEYLTGAEYSVALVGNPRAGLTALPVLEVDYANLDPDLPPILGYESKWLPASPYWSQIAYREAALDAETLSALVQRSEILFERLRCQDYARFDFRADASGEIKLLEVNPNPGWCWDGKLNLMAGFGGMAYPELLRAILDAAGERVGGAAQMSCALAAVAMDGAVFEATPIPA